MNVDTVTKEDISVYRLNPVSLPTHPMTNSRFSIVIPAKDEAESLGDLLKEISAALGGDSFEVIVVDDGSMDGTADVLQRLMGSASETIRLAAARAVLVVSNDLRKTVEMEAELKELNRRLDEMEATAAREGKR